MQLTNHQPTEHVLLIGHGSQDALAVADYQHFAQQLAQRLARPVQSCFLEFAAPPIVDGLRACVEAGAQRVIALPLFLGAATHQKNDVPTILNWAKAQWPATEFRYGVPLGVQPHIVNALAYNIDQLLATVPPVSLAETAIIVVGRGSRDPDSNSEVSKIARLLYEGRPYGWVEVAFYDLTTPRIELMVERCAKLGARRIIVLPYLLFSGRIATRIAERLHRMQAACPATELLLGSPLGVSEHLVEAAAYRYEQVVAGVATMNCDVCKYRHRLRGFEQEVNLPQESDHNHGLRGVAALLPPRYQNGNGVSAAPMVAAPLRYDAEGRVAWDQLWDTEETDSPFCELALAGGPPHRGALLEPVLPSATTADPANYQRVLAELTRAIQMTTGLQTQLSAAPGWIGVRCYTDEMAIWLLRAIVVENVSVRREENILFLPAGPHFQLEQEIKNVVTALAKTHHYWQEHLRGQRQTRG
ncbi:MAG: sirohydrochlorin chelatase [Chloroflexi bacterium]|nr:sirohydrochlorin chelatase [Chloroflexota bacterium]